MAILCTRCGKNLALVGRVHHCVPWADAPAIVPSPNAASVTHAVTHSVTHAKRLSGAERQARHRAKNPEGYRQRHRELMRKRRAAARAS